MTNFVNACGMVRLYYVTSFSVSASVCVCMFACDSADCHTRMSYRRSHDIPHTELTNHKPWWWRLTGHRKERLVCPDRNCNQQPPSRLAYAVTTRTRRLDFWRKEQIGKHTHIVVVIISLLMLHQTLANKDYLSIKLQIIPWLCQAKSSIIWIFFSSPKATRSALYIGY